MFRQKLTLASFEDERNSFPSGIVDPEGRGGKGWAHRVRWDGIIIKITGFPVSRHVLAE
jgi:hypothetical protein